MENESDDKKTKKTKKGRVGIDEEEPRNPTKGERVLAHTRKKGPFLCVVESDPTGRKGDAGKRDGGAKRLKNVVVTRAQTQQAARVEAAGVAIIKIKKGIMSMLF